jgi:hypothetical protein
MPSVKISAIARSAAGLLFVTIIAASCGGSYEETIGGVAIPVPKGMARISEKPVEISLLGFGAAQATFLGAMDTNQIVDFYQKELPARGWQANMNLRSGGAMLAYSKDGQIVLIGVGNQDGETRLSLTVSGARK